MKKQNDIIVTQEILDDRLEKLEKKIKEDFQAKDNAKTYPTKHDLIRALSKYPTLDKLKKILEAHPTQKYLQIEIALMHILIDENSKALDDKNRGYRDEILTGLDKVVKELQEIRDENAASTLHFERNGESIKNHETRIKTLELASSQ